MAPVPNERDEAAMVSPTYVPFAGEHRGASRLLKGLVLSFVLAGAALGSVQRSQAAQTSPKSVRATAIRVSSGNGLLRPGTAVKAPRLGVRVYINASRGVALNSGESLHGVTYPLATVNGGRTWKIAGPALHVPAANAPDVVTQIGATPPSTYFVFGGPGGANSVDVTADGGAHWFRAYLGDGVVAAVVASSGELFAFTGSAGAYYSKDKGRTWHHMKTLI
jgi:hypothetical protein